MQKHCVDNRENCSVSTDSQRKREERHHGERFVPEQSPHGIADIGPGLLQPQKKTDLSRTTDYDRASIKILPGVSLRTE
jgi:hypothetical protein